MTIRHIRIFLEVCRTMNVTRAAENLYMTQPAVSRSIHEIEQVYGVRLFERLNQRLYLTDSGRRKGLVVFRRHEGLRSFFHEMLGLDREQSSEMACCMEHYIDTVTEERLYALLEYFRRARAEREPWVDEAFVALEKPILLPLPLTLSQEGTKGHVTRLTADEPLRKKLLDAGLASGATVTLLAVKGGDYTVQIKRRSVELSLNEAATVWLQPI